jgi:hypothetical protein
VRVLVHRCRAGRRLGALGGWRGSSWAGSRQRAVSGAWRRGGSRPAESASGRGTASVGQRGREMAGWSRCKREKGREARRCGGGGLGPLPRQRLGRGPAAEPASGKRKTKPSSVIPYRKNP